MWGKKPVTVRTGPRRFVSSIQFQSWVEILSSLPWSSTPAALTRMSTWPIALIESRTSERTEESLRMSVDMAIAESQVPSFSPSSTVFSIGGTSKSATTTLAPWRARALAIALPIPLPPPVTTATLPPRAPRGAAFFASKTDGTANTMHRRYAKPVRLRDWRQPDDWNLAVCRLLVLGVVGELRHDALPGLGALSPLHQLGLHAHAAGAGLHPDLVRVTGHVQIPARMFGVAALRGDHQPCIAFGQAHQVHVARPPALRSDRRQDHGATHAPATQETVDARYQSHDRDRGARHFFAAGSWRWDLERHRR